MLFYTPLPHTSTKRSNATAAFARFGERYEMDQRTWVIPLLISLNLHASGVVLLAAFAQKGQPAERVIVIGLEAPPKGVPDGKGALRDKNPPTPKAKPVIARNEPVKKPAPVASVRKDTAPKPVPKVAQEKSEKAESAPPEKEKPAAVPQPTSPPVPQQPAAPPASQSGAGTQVGTGSQDRGTPDGTSGGGSWPTISMHAVGNYEWSAYVRSVLKRIEDRLTYPEEEYRRGNVGVLDIKLGLERSGRLMFVHIEQSSGNAAFDADAVQAVYRAAPFPPIPQQNFPGVNLRGKVRYRLN